MLSLPKGFIAIGSLGSLVIKIATAATAFVTHALLARWMGAGPYGIYIYALTWISLLVLLASLGTDGLLTRFAAVYTAEEKWAALKGLLRFGYGTVGLSSVLLAALVWLGLWLSPVSADAERFRTFSLALLLLPLTAIGGVAQAWLYGLKHPWLAQSPELIGRILMVLCAGGAYGYFAGLTSAVAMECSLAVAAVALILGLQWLIRSVPRPVWSEAASYAVRAWLGVALPLLSMSFLRILMNQSAVLLLGWLLLEEKSAGIYAVAARLAELTTFGLQAANTTLAPTISELHARCEKHRLQAVVGRSARGVFAFTLAVSLVLGIAGEQVLQLFGAEFTAAYPTLLVLLIGQTVNAATGPVGYLMTMTGNQQAAARLAMISALATVLLHVLLIPRFGILGAGFASMAGVSFLNLSMLVFVRLRLKINSTVFARYGSA